MCQLCQNLPHPSDLVVPCARPQVSSSLGDGPGEPQGRPEVPARSLAPKQSRPRPTTSGSWCINTPAPSLFRWDDAQVSILQCFLEFLGGINLQSLSVTTGFVTHYYLPHFPSLLLQYPGVVSAKYSLLLDPDLQVCFWGNSGDGEVISGLGVLGRNLRGELLHLEADTGGKEASYGLPGHSLTF